MANLLISASRDDAAKRYGYWYLWQFAEWVNNHTEHKAYVLTDPLLPDFQKALVSLDPQLVILNGHGGRKGVTGLNDNVILGVKTWDPELNVKIKAENPKWMTGRLVYLLTCFTGRELAPRLALTKAKAVVAYQSSFIFLTGDETPPDEQSEPFFKAALTYPKALLEGFKAGESYRMLEEDFMMQSNLMARLGEKQAAEYLWHDYYWAVFYGDPSATLL